MRNLGGRRAPLLRPGRLEASLPDGIHVRSCWDTSPRRAVGRGEWAMLTSADVRSALATDQAFEAGLIEYGHCDYCLMER